MKLPDLDGIDLRVDMGQILAASEVHMLTDIIRAFVNDRQLPLLFPTVVHKPSAMGSTELSMTETLRWASCSEEYRK